MTDLIATGAAWLADKLKSHAGQAVTYSRPSTGQAVALTATPGRTEFEEADAEGVVTTFHSKDFLFPTADLVLGGVATLPLAGDRIVVALGGQTLTHEVLERSGGDQHFRFTDPHRTGLRVHTKQIGIA